MFYISRFYFPGYIRMHAVINDHESQENGSWSILKFGAPAPLTKS
jgi:hypothetical protein